MTDSASERIERSALTDIHAAATPELRNRLALDCVANGSTLVSVAGALPPSAIVINRALGLGLDRPATETSVARIIDRYRDAGVERYFVQVHPDSGPPDLVAWLESLGLEKARGWQKFVRTIEPAPAVQTDLRIEPIGAKHADAFARIVCDAFDLGDAAQPWLATLPGRANWHVFMSFAGNEPAGTGALFVEDGIGWTDFGATAPEFRRRGSQGAILARRIDHAIELGCKEIHTCTGEDVAGDPQHSSRNILKLGFETSYVRANYAPPRP